SEKRAIKVGRTAYLQNPQVELEKRGRLLDCLELIRAGGRIPQRGHAGKTRDSLLQELEPLRPKLGEIEKEPGDVATGPRVAGNRAGGARVRLQIVRAMRGMAAVAARTIGTAPVLRGLRVAGFRVPEEVEIISQVADGDPARLSPLAAAQPR